MWHLYITVEVACFMNFAALCLMIIRASNEMLLVKDRICPCSHTKKEVTHLSSRAQETQSLRVTYPLRPNWAGFVKTYFLPGEWGLILSQNTVHYFFFPSKWDNGQSTRNRLKITECVYELRFVCIRQPFLVTVNLVIDC